MSQPQVYIRAIELIEACRNAVTMVTTGDEVRTVQIGHEPKFIYMGSEPYSSAMRECPHLFNADRTNPENYTFLGIPLRRVLNDRYHMQVI